MKMFSDHSANKFYTFLTCCILLIMTSCGSDEESSGDDFTGTWLAAITEVTGCADAEDNVTTTCQPACITLIIDSNGNFTKEEVIDAMGNTSTTDGTITVTESDFIICQDEDNCIRWAFSFDGTTLTLSFVEEDDGCSIVETYTRL